MLTTLQVASLVIQSFCNVFVFLNYYNNTLIKHQPQINAYPFRKIIE